MPKVTLGIMAMALLAAACGHHKDASSPEEDDAVVAVRKRAAFDLGCAENDVKVQQLQEGSFATVASYGATCGEKRASYMERMGTVIKQ